MNFQSRKFQFLAFGFAFLAMCALAVQAQSGRRQPKPPSPAPVETPSPEPSPTPTPQQKAPEMGFSLGADRFGFESYPASYYDAALQGCAERLRTASSARVDVSLDSISRGEAIKKAKEETKTYTIYMKFNLDQTARSLDDLELQFTVFAPETAKVVGTFNGYLNTNRKGPIILGPRGSTGGALYREDLIRRAAEDAAERILKALNLNVPILH